MSRLIILRLSTGSKWTFGKKLIRQSLKKCRGNTSRTTSLILSFFLFFFLSSSLVELQIEKRRFCYTTTVRAHLHRVLNWPSSGYRNFLSVPRKSNFFLLYNSYIHVYTYVYSYIYIYNICKSRRAINRSTTFKIAGNCSRVSYF